MMKAVLKNAQINTVRKNLYFQSFVILLLTFLAFSRFTPGGDILSPESGSRGVVEIGLFSLALLLMFLLWGKKIQLRELKIPIYIFALLFGVWAIISAFWSQNQMLTLGKAFGFIAITIISCTLAYVTKFYGISLEHLVLDTIIVFNLFLFVINLSMFGTLFPIDWSSSRPRFFLAYNHPNITGSYFAVGTLLSFYLLMIKNRKNTRFGYLFLVLFFAVLLYLTDARSQMGSTIIALLVMTMFLFKFKALIVNILVSSSVVVAISIFIFITVPTFWKVLLDGFFQAHPDYLTLNGRIFLWRDFVHLLQSINLLRGTGYAATRYWFLNEYKWAVTAHNALLEMLVGTGLVGILLFLGFYLSALLILLRQPRKYIFPLAILAYISCTGVFNVSLFYPVFETVIFFLFIFQSAVIVHLSGTNNTHPVL
jgi:O-antigen ligase